MARNLAQKKTSHPSNSLHTITENRHTDNPCRQDPNLGEDKDGLLGPKKDEYKICSLLDKAHPKFWVQAVEDSQFCQGLRYQNGSKGLVRH